MWLIIICIIVILLCLFSLSRTPIYVISLERRVDRRQRILGAIGWSFYYYVANVHAVNGAETLEHFITHPGEAGCSLSHIYMWEQFLKSNAPYALILEDDADIKLPEDWKLVKMALKHTPANWDLIWIGSKRIFNPEKNIIVNEHIQINKSKLWGTHAYLISKQGAEKVYNKYKYMQNFKKLKDFTKELPIDDLLSQSDISQYILSHSLIQQFQSKSDTY